MAQRRWRRLNGAHLLPLVRAGVVFVDGVIETEARKEAAGSRQGRSTTFDNSSPPELGRLTGVRWLDLSYNHLSGSLPPELGQLVNLEEMDLNWNYLSGSLPRGLGRLLNLERLFLNNNRLCGPLPLELGRLARLETVELSGNDLTGRVPPEWLRNLTEAESLRQPVD